MQWERFADSLPGSWLAFLAGLHWWQSVELTRHSWAALLTLLPQRRICATTTPSYFLSSCKPLYNIEPWLFSQAMVGAAAAAAGKHHHGQWWVPVAAADFLDCVGLHLTKSHLWNLTCRDHSQILITLSKPVRYSVNVFLGKTAIPYQSSSSFLEMFCLRRKPSVCFRFSVSKIRWQLSDRSRQSVCSRYLKDVKV